MFYIARLFIPGIGLVEFRPYEFRLRLVTRLAGDYGTSDGLYW